jgi:uncharacterized protein with HEPN domain
MYRDAEKSAMDALEACRTIEEFSAGHTLASYQSSRLLRSAVERQFEILGEALNRIDNADPSLRNCFPEMGAVIGMRNRIIHGYDCVDDAIVWDAVGKHVPSLTNKLKAWLEGGRLDG